MSSGPFWSASKILLIGSGDRRRCASGGEACFGPPRVRLMVVCRERDGSMHCWFHIRHAPKDDYVAGQLPLAEKSRDLVFASQPKHDAECQTEQGSADVQHSALRPERLCRNTGAVGNGEALGLL